LNGELLKLISSNFAYYCFKIGRSILNWIFYFYFKLC